MATLNPYLALFLLPGAQHHSFPVLVSPSIVLLSKYGVKSPEKIVVGIII